MKKILKLMAVAASTTMMLAACGGGGADGEQDNNESATQQQTEEPTQEVNIVKGAPMQDGTYSLVEKDFDENGWKVEFDITVQNGKITESNFDYVNADGELKSEDDGYQEMMKDKTGVGPQEFITQLNDGLTREQNAQNVDVVSGATHSSESFLNYAQQLIQAAQAGDETTIEIDNNAPLQDGTYSLEEKNIGSTGWKTFITITIKDNKITEVDYNDINEEGELKTDDEGYQEQMSEIAGTGPQDFIPALSEALLEKQNAYEVDLVSGATHSAHSFKLYAAQLINAAQKGNTDQIIVDNYVYDEN